MSTDTVGETFVAACRPYTFRQVLECTTDGTGDAPHAMHRKLTELAHFTCNCGYSSGWVPKDELPLASDFIRDHLPPDVEWPPDGDGA